MYVVIEIKTTLYRIVARIHLPHTTKVWSTIRDQDQVMRRNNINNY